ncbi:MAG TPA: phenylalanine--tRNA ligase subunit alpha [Methanotrichaceae archaeon]|nr:phenylalanine--tRNA ligase subunit alpha [Methanotrichaceae archaeon]
MPSEEDNLSALSPRDRQVLKEISEGQSDPKEIAEKLKIKEVSVISSAEGLAERGLIGLDKKVEEVYALTEEGARYAEVGLPERKILEIAGAEGVSISKIEDPSLKVGIGWLKKKGWATVEAGKIKLMGEAPPGKDEETLEALHFQGETSASALDAKAIKMLKSRGLVEPSTYKSWSFEITDAGRSVSRKPVEDDVTLRYDSISYITQITSDMIKNGVWEGKYVNYKGARYEVRPYNVALSAERIYPGKVHPYQRLLQRMREIMLEMGFTEIKGEIVQSSYWNFDALFQPQDHPAREMQDTFYLDSKAEIPDYSNVKDMHERGGQVGSTGWGGTWDPAVARKEVLRTHTTSVTIKYLADHPNPPVKAFSIDRVYRREAIDPTHTPEFEQLEGVIMDEGLSFSNLLGVLEEFYAKMGFDEVRFRPGYFPYTEPSVEPEIYIDGLGWVELGGAGVFRREVTAPFGIDHPVLAWGLGVGRLAMLRLGLKDLRLLYQSDVGWLRDVPLSTRM